MEEEALQFQETLQLGNIRGSNDVVKAYVLERDLFDGLLEVWVVEHLEGVSVDEELVVALDLSVTRLNKALGPGLFSPLVAIETEASDSLHFVLPLLADNLKKALW